MRTFRIWYAAVLVVVLSVAARADNPGHAITFNGHTDGSGSYVEILDSDAFDLAQPFTVEAWVNWTGDLGYRVFLSKAVGDTPGFVVTGYSIVIWDGKACLALQGPGVSRVSCSSSPISAATWTQVAVTYDGQVANVYINGLLSSTVDWGFVAFPFTDADAGLSTSLLIGREFFTDLVDRTFPGTLDEVRMWGTALSADTIQSWFNSTVNHSHPDVADLIAYYRFNEGLSQDPTTHDHSGNGHGGTLMNGAVRVRSTAPAVK
jgi:hypothetical protein